MKHLRLDKILDILIEFCYLAIIFFVPVYFAVFLNNNDVFELNKIILFKVLTLLLLLFSLIRLALKNIKRQIGHLISLPFLSKYLLIPFLFLLLLAIATIFSQNIEISFYGLYSRYQGLNSYIYYFIFFILLLINIKNIIQINRIVITAVVSSFFVSLYGIAQIAGFDFINWTEPAFLTHRATSTLGQPNFLASYLLLVIPLCIYLILQTKKFLIRFFWIIIFIFQILCLFFTYSRGGWIGLAMGITLTGIIYLWITKDKNLLKNKKNIKFFLLAIFLIIIFSSFLLYKNDSLRNRIKSGFDFKSGSVAVRMNFWQASIDAFKKKPFLGYGLENQGDIFVKYYKKDWAIYGNVNVYPNRAHNLFFDILLSSGLVGLISYLALLYLFYKLILENIKNKRHRGLALAIFLAITSYLISLMFNFSIVATNVYFWLFLAIIILINNNFPSRYNNLANREGKEFNLLTKLIIIILIISVSCVILRQINKEIKYIIADHYYYEFKESHVRNEFFNTLEMYNYIDKLNIWDDYYKKEMAVKLAEKFNDIPFQDFKKQIEKILGSELEDIKVNSYSNILAKAKIYIALASNEQKNYFSLAEEHFKKLIDLSPEMPRNYYELAKLYIKEKKLDIAEEYFNQALAMLPSVNNPYINNIHRRIVEYEKYLIFKELASLYFIEENYKKSNEYYWLAFYNNMSDITMYKKIADVYYKQGDLGKAIWYNKKGMALNPSDYTWSLAIALLYEEKGDSASALEYADIAFELAPDKQGTKEMFSK